VAYAIPSEEFLAIALLLADGNTAIRLAEVVRRADRYQKEVSAHYGVSADDFRGAMLRLGIEAGFFSDADVWKRGSAVLELVTLKQGIGPMLTYVDVYFNDEGEHWCSAADLGMTDDTISRRFRMADFFADPANDAPALVRRFLHAAGWKTDTLRRWLESEFWRWEEQHGRGTHS